MNKTNSFEKSKIIFFSEFRFPADYHFNLAKIGFEAIRNPTKSNKIPHSLSRGLSSNFW